MTLFGDDLGLAQAGGAATLGGDETTGPLLGGDEGDAVGVVEGDSTEGAARCSMPIMFRNLFRTA